MEPCDPHSAAAFTTLEGFEAAKASIDQLAALVEMARAHGMVLALHHAFHLFPLLGRIALHASRDPGPIRATISFLAEDGTLTTPNQLAFRHLRRDPALPASAVKNEAPLPPASPAAASSPTASFGMRLGPPYGEAPVRLNMRHLFDNAALKQGVGCAAHIRLAMEAFLAGAPGLHAQAHGQCSRPPPGALISRGMDPASIARAIGLPELGAHIETICLASAAGQPSACAPRRAPSL